MLSPFDWVTSAASPGYCAQTSPSDAGDCAAGDHGSWGLQKSEKGTMLIAATACLKRCAGCSRCNYITVSLEWEHCSWHHVCAAPLLEDAPNFVSGAAYPHASRRAAHSNHSTYGERDQGRNGLENTLLLPIRF